MLTIQQLESTTPNHRRRPSTIKSSKPSPLTSPALETEMPLKSLTDSPLIIKPRCASFKNKTTPMSLTYRSLPLAQVALLSMVSQRVILVVTQPPVQAMSTAMV
jgi:hypothetical protein